jgi:hypothetical protein
MYGKSLFVEKSIPLSDITDYVETWRTPDKDPYRPKTPGFQIHEIRREAYGIERGGGIMSLNKDFLNSIPIRLDDKEYCLATKIFLKTG